MNRVNLLPGQRTAVVLATMPLVVLALAVCHAQTSGILEKREQPVAYLLETDGNLSFEEVSSPGIAGRFTEQETGLFNFGQTRSGCWIRFNPRKLAPPGSTGTLYVSFVQPTLEQVVLYVPRALGEASHSVRLNAGWMYGAEHDDQGFNYPVFQLGEGATAGECFAYVKTPFSLNFVLRVDDEGTHQQTRKMTFLVQGLLFGILAAMALYNLFLFLFLRERAYCLYVLYLLSLGAYQAELVGLTRVLDPAVRGLLIPQGALIAALTAILATEFTRSYLNTSHNCPKLDVALRVTRWILVVPIVLTLAG